jgi:glucose-6-phosphate isomerase
MLSKINPTQTNSWKALDEQFANNDFDLRSLFQYNPNRFNEFSIKRPNFLFDYSKNLIDSKRKNSFKSCGRMRIERCDFKMFSGDKINETEGRAVLHTALRDFSDKEILVDGENIKPQIKEFWII